MSDGETQYITVPQGEIKGLKRQAVYGQTYYSFEGIPFAKPPIGELRFKAPQPTESWQGVKDCTKPASRPAQKNFRTGVFAGSEDCLYVNVYAKELKSDKPVPVIVWIYGGGFVINGALPELYGPDYFMRENVILVNFNYRLCSLGFLSLKDPALKVPGNAGLKDQVLALKWIKDNISYFGGDPNNITIFGDSAGGASVHIMAATNQTKGLFQKAIAMSGCFLNYWATLPHNDMGYRLAKQHGYTGDNVDKQVLEFLNTLSPDQLVDHSLLTLEERLNGWLFDFGPTIEPYVDEDCVIPTEPVEMLRTAWSNEIPLMLGCTSDEGIFMYPQLKAFPERLVAMYKNPEYLLPPEVRDANDSETNKRLGAKLRELHLGDKEPTAEDIPKFMDFNTHKIFWHGVHRTILSRAAYASAPTYVYRFNFDSPDYNHYRKLFSAGDSLRGTAHGDDISYLFHAEFNWKVSEDSLEYKTIERVVGMWTAFAKNSDPNCAEIEPVTWKPLSQGGPTAALNISTEVEFIELPEKPKFEVWDSLYKKEDLF